jgi:hypothetical protein
MPRPYRRPIQTFGAVRDIYKTLTISREMGYVGDIKGLVSYLTSQVSPD